MSKAKLVIVAPTIGVCVLLAGAILWAREDPDERRPEVEPKQAEVEPEQLERRLDEIEELLERAEQKDDDRRVRELRHEAEKILDRLERIERSREDEGEEGEESEEEWEHRHRQLELERMEHDLHRISLEVQMLRLEIATRRTEVASHPLAAAAHAVESALMHLEHDDAAEFLGDVLKQSSSPVVNTLLRQRLAELYIELDRPEDAKSILRSLILGE